MQSVPARLGAGEHEVRSLRIVRGLGRAMEALDHGELLLGRVVHRVDDRVLDRNRPAPGARELVAALTSRAGHLREEDEQRVAVLALDVRTFRSGVSGTGHSFRRIAIEPIPPPPDEEFRPRGGATRRSLLGRSSRASLNGCTCRGTLRTLVVQAVEPLRVFRNGLPPFVAPSRAALFGSMARTCHITPFRPKQAGK